MAFFCGEPSALEFDLGSELLANWPLVPEPLDPSRGTVPDLSIPNHQLDNSNNSYGMNNTLTIVSQENRYSMNNPTNFNDRAAANNSGYQLLHRQNQGLHGRREPHGLPPAPAQHTQAPARAVMHPSHLTTYTNALRSGPDPDGIATGPARDGHNIQYTFRQYTWMVGGANQKPPIATDDTQRQTKSTSPEPPVVARSKKTTGCY